MRNAKLWVFGDSFSAPFNTHQNHDGGESAYTKYKKWRGGNFPPIWPQILSEKLGYELVNFSEGGSCNYKIFNKICDNCDKFENGDMVIIGWTFVTRFRLSNNHNFVSISYSDVDGQEYWGGPEVIKNIALNRMENAYVKEIYSFENIIDQVCKLKGSNVFYWSADDTIINAETYEFRNKNKYIIPECDRGMLRYLEIRYGAQTISKETRMDIHDQHFGQIGHEVMADRFHKTLLARNVINYNTKTLV